MPLQTIEKVGRVFSLFDQERSEWGVSEVAGALGLPKSGAHALVSTLAGQGLLRRTKRGRYRLGWRMLSLSETLMQTTDFRPEAQRAMEHLVSRFGELMHLGALQDAKVVCVEKVGGVRMPRVPDTGRGLTLPAHGSAVGKVLLAHRPWKKVTQHLWEHIPALTPNTIISSDGLREELVEVRERGYALDLEEMMLGLCCVAAPIRDRTGEVVAAMSFSVPAYRFEQGKDRYVAAITQAANSVSENIGYFP